MKVRLSIEQLPRLCRSIDTAILDKENSGTIYCAWGKFEVNREQLDNGIRFSLPHCPNALAWTITMDEDSHTIIIHRTINKKQHDAEFIETIKQFVDDWSFSCNTN